MADADPGSLRDSLRKEPAQFGAVVAGFRERMRRMVDLRMDPLLRGRLDASDVVQEACVEAVRRLPEWLADDSMPLHLWLRLLTEQRLKQLHRFHVTSGMRGADQEVRLDGDATEVRAERLADALVESGVLSPSGVAVRAEVLARLHAALSSMKAEDREVLALRHFEELTNADVARLLGIAISAASHRYMRAARRLREILGDLSGAGT